MKGREGKGTCSSKAARSFSAQKKTSFYVIDAVKVTMENDC